MNQKKALVLLRPLASALSAALLLTACGGQGSEAATPNLVTPTQPPAGMGGTTPAPAPAPSPAPSTQVRGTCTNNASGATGVNTCFELERIGGLARSFIEVSSVSLSSSYDRAQTLLMAGAAINCPVSGSISASSARINEITLSYQACDFGLGAMTGSVLSRDRRSDSERARGDEAGSADITLDITTSRVRYQTAGSVLPFMQTRFQHSAQGSILLNGQEFSIPLLVSLLVLRVDGTQTTYDGTLNSQHGDVFSNGAFIGQPRSGRTELEITSAGNNLFVVVGAPTFTSNLSYFRIAPSSAPPASVQTRGDLTGAATGFTTPLRNTDTNGQENLAAEWQDLIAQPRYEFVQ